MVWPRIFKVATIKQLFSDKGVAVEEIFSEEIIEGFTAEETVAEITPEEILAAVGLVVLGKYSILSAGTKDQTVHWVKKATLLCDNRVWLL